jgi:hypothetical protein
MIDIGKIIGQSDLEYDFEGVCRRLDTEKELIVFCNNNPQYVLMTIENYERIKGEALSKEDDAEVLNDESLETLLNKIGKKIFIDYYYVFKEDVNPEEKLPRDFTINSRRSRSSSARKIFKNGLEIAALNNIVQSYRLDETTLTNARTILDKETGNTSSRTQEAENNVKFENDIEMKIGKSARTLISRFLQEGIITKNEVLLMQESDYSKKVFNLNFPVIKEIDSNLDLDQQKKDQRGYNRYYDTIVQVYGKDYLLCSQWVENLHKAAFEKWIEPKLISIIINCVEGLKIGTEFIIPNLLNEYWSYIPYGTRKSLGKKFVEKVRNNIVSNIVELTGSKRNNSQVYIKK